MRRRDALLGGGLLLAAAPAAQAQSPRRPRVGVLVPGTSASDRIRIAALREGLAARGHVEPATIELFVRFADGRIDRLPGEARVLVAAQPDLIVAWGTAGVRATMDATTTLPIVCATADDLLASGLVPSLARPGSNLTGITLLASDIALKELELLIEIVPGLARVAVLWSPGGGGEIALRSLTEAARARGIAIASHEIAAPDRLEAAFAATTAARGQGVILIANVVLRLARDRIVSLAAAHRLPVVASQREYVDAGCLASYGADTAAMFVRAGYFVDRILKGAKPSELPVEQPTAFVQVLNLRTARALGLTIPPIVLARADEVIE